MIIDTVKATCADKDIQYLFHAGPLRSHTLYVSSSEVNQIDFKQQNYESGYLEMERKRVNDYDSVIESEVIKLEVSDDYKFIRELPNKTLKGDAHA
jgi:capsular polysaccharide biosynthesis protein